MNICPQNEALSPKMNICPQNEALSPKQTEFLINSGEAQSPILGKKFADD
jgi:hypothetical protein